MAAPFPEYWRVVLMRRVSASLLVYDYGATKAAIQSAKASVAATRESLRDLEQTVLLDAVTAFMDVLQEAAVTGGLAEGAGGWWARRASTATWPSPVCRAK